MRPIAQIDNLADREEDEVPENQSKSALDVSQGPQGSGLDITDVKEDENRDENGDVQQEDAVSKQKSEQEELMNNVNSQSTARGLLQEDEKDDYVPPAKKQPWRFFDNQIFIGDKIGTFDNAEFYGDGWKNLLSEDIAKAEGGLNRIQVVKTEETYEPRILSFEMAEWIREERKQLRDMQLNDIEAGHDIFTIVKKKELAAFKEMFAEEEDEEGENRRNFNEHTFAAFDSGQCNRHRNAIEFFSFNEDYFVISKSFVHKKANSRLQMRIFRFTPSKDDKKGSIYQCHEVNWPIVDSSACFDPSMISVIQWNQWLYFFKIQNHMDDADAIFSMFRFDLVTEEESFVKDFHFSWPKPEIEEDEQSEEHSHTHESVVDEGTLRAYSAVFMKIDSKVCEDEEQFVNRRMIALIFESEEEAPDQSFIFKIRRLANFNSDLYFNKTPIPTDMHFRFQYFMEDSCLKRQAFALINAERIMIVPVDLAEITEVSQKEYYHYPDRECTCCNDVKKTIAKQLKETYLTTFKVLESFNTRGEEEYRYLEIKKIDLTQEMIGHLTELSLDALNPDYMRDSLQIVLDKRTHRFIFVLNVLYHDMRDEIKIYESKPLSNIRNAFNYDPQRLHIFARYVYHERDKFLDKLDIKDKKYQCIKQMFELFPNVVVEARKNTEKEDQFIVAFEYPSKEGDGTELHIALDEARNFVNSFRAIDTSQEIQFIQLAADDRMILPRVTKDEDRQQFLFQLYNYMPPQRHIQKIERDHQDTDDEDLDQFRRQQDQEDKARILVELPLDLSTSNLDFGSTNAFIAPCTSVYRQNYGQAAREYVQDFQVLVYGRHCQMARVFQYRVFYQKNKSAEEAIEMPYIVRANLVGMKILIVRPSDSLEKSGFFSLYDEEGQIYGTQFILNKRYIIDMPNFERNEWTFSSDVAMSGYKMYYNQTNLDEECLLMQANLSEVLLTREQFSESDHSMLLKMQIRILMNIVPYSLDQLLCYDINETNFLQPLELLGTQNMCAIVLDDPGYVSDILKLLITQEREQKSLFEFFIKELDDKQRDALFSEDYYIPRQEEVSRDIVCCNNLLRCFETEQPMSAVLEKLLEYMFNRPFSKNQSMIFMEIMPHMLKQEESSNEFAKFFIDSPSAHINFNKIGSRLTVILDHNDLPRYSNNIVTLHEFTDKKSLGSQTDVKKWMQHHIIHNRILNETATIPVRHYYIDFRVLNLGFKLDQFRNGQDIAVEDISDYDVASYLFRICRVYGRDIEYQDSTRNLIDDMFYNVMDIFNLQAAFFLIFVMIPMTLQVFVLENVFHQRAASIICLWALCIYTLYMICQIVFQKMEYFKRYNNIIDILIVIVYFIYFGFKDKDARIYLPEKILEDGDYQLDRRLAKAGSGGGGLTGAGGILSNNTLSLSGSGYGGFFDVFDFELRTVDKIAFQAFLHTVLLISSALKSINLLQVYGAFQDLILVLRFCIKKSLPFLLLVYFWILCSSLMFRILGATNPTETPDKEEYAFFGIFFTSWLNTYKLAIGNDLNLEYPLWQKFNPQNPNASQFAAVLIWVVWLSNNFAIFIFGLNFLVSLIAQGYEEALYHSRLETYAYRCEKVLEATVISKMFHQGRTLQTFSLSIANSADYQSWPGVVKSVKTYIRDQNISLKSGIFERIDDIQKSLDTKTNNLKTEVQEMRQQLVFVNENLTSKLDYLTDSLKQINDHIKGPVGNRRLSKDKENKEIPIVESNNGIDFQSHIQPNKK